MKKLKDNIHAILHGTKEEKAKLKGHFFYLADTPKFIKDIGLTGDYFEVRYGVITRHTGKDKDHYLSEDNWKDLCNAITNPFAIAKYGEGYRLFTSIKLYNNYIVVGVDVKNIGKGIDVNSVSTAFTYDHNRNEDFIYRAKNITPDQAALLDGPNFLSLPPEQGSN